MIESQVDEQTFLFRSGRKSVNNLRVTPPNVSLLIVAFPTGVVETPVSAVSHTVRIDAVGLCTLFCLSFPFPCFFIIILIISQVI